MEERRKFHRSPTKQNGEYFLGGEERVFGVCTITDISRGGMGIRFNTARITNIGSIIRLKIAAKSLSTFVKVRGILKWTKRKNNDSTAGIKITGLN